MAFSGNILKQTKIAYNHGRIVNIYIVYKLEKRSNNNPHITLENSLFGAVKLTKNVDISKYSYNGYGIPFDGNGGFLHSSGEIAKNLIIFGCDINSSVHKNNRNDHILLLGKDFTQGINGTTNYA